MAAADQPPIKSVIIVGAGKHVMMMGSSVERNKSQHPPSSAHTPQTTPSTNRKGIGGLCVANALRQKGLKVTVFERSKELSRQR